MTSSNSTTPDMLAALPLQATGSGVADLEIAYEQMQLLAEASPTNPSGPGSDDTATPSGIPTESGEDANESAAHPS